MCGLFLGYLSPILTFLKCENEVFKSTFYNQRNVVMATSD